MRTDIKILCAKKYLVSLKKTRAFLRTNLLVPIIIFRFFGKHCWICLREHFVSTSKKHEFPRTNLLVPFVNFHFSEESEEISFLSWKTYVLQFKNCICSILFGQNCMKWLFRTIFCRWRPTFLPKSKRIHIICIWLTEKILKPF